MGSLEKGEQDMGLYFLRAKDDSRINFVAHISDLNISITTHILFVWICTLNETS
jgi:hypothetical protein